MSLRRTARAVVAGTILLLLSALATLPASAQSSDSGAPTVAASASPSYIPAGTPIDGGDNAAGGPLLPGPGLYLDTLPQGSSSIGEAGSDKFYTVQLPLGVTPWFSATLLFPAQRSNAAPGGVTLRVFDLAQDYQCTWEVDDYDNESSSATQPLSVAEPLPTVDGTSWRKQNCPVHQLYVVEVYRSGQLFANDSAQVEIGYRIEPPASTANIPTTPATTGAAVPVQGGAQVQDFTAGYSFNNAPVLAPGRYRDTIVPGQTRFVRVHLNWGQRFSYLFQSDSVPALGDLGLSVWTTLFNPMRGSVQPTSTTSTFVDGFGGKDAQPVSGTTAVPVRYANRYADQYDEAQPYSIDGDYYLAVTVGYANSSRPIRVPYTLIVSVSGRVEPGPSYEPAQVSLPNTGTSSGPVASGSSGSGTSTGLIIGIAAAAVVVVAAIAILLRRRGRPTHGPTGAGPLPVGPTPGRISGPGPQGAPGPPPDPPPAYRPPPSPQAGPPAGPYGRPPS